MLPDGTRPIEGYSNYSISDQGHVWSVPRKMNSYRGSWLLLQKSGGYFKVSLCNDEGTVSEFIHILVARAFIPNPSNLPEVNHKDGNGQNNCVDNLEWTTALGNAWHRDNVIDMHIRGERAPQTVLTDNNALEIRYKYAAGGHTHRSLAKEYGVSGRAIWAILNRVTWKHI